MKIVYFGTPDFAVAPLDRLLTLGHEIAAVVTVPDHPARRGGKPQPSPVKTYAAAHGLTVIQPANLKEPGWIDTLRSYNADMFVVVAFRMLPECVWSMPPLGTINLHASLLPDYRGAAPINRAIMNGETETGVTTFRIRHDIDTGDILMRSKVAISDDDDAGTLHDRLMEEGAMLLGDTIKAIEEGTVTPTAQPEENPKPAPKIFKDMCRIDFGGNAADISNFIRGLSPYPGAWMDIDSSLTMKIFSSICERDGHDHRNDVMSDGKSYLKIGCADGWIYLMEVQLPGKKRMGIRDFLNGNSMIVTYISSQMSGNMTEIHVKTDR